MEGGRAEVATFQPFFDLFYKLGSMTKEKKQKKGGKVRGGGGRKKKKRRKPLHHRLVILFPNIRLVKTCTLELLYKDNQVRNKL